MSPNPEVGRITLQVDAGPDSIPEEVDAVTRELRDEIQQLDVSSVELVRSGEAPAGAKFFDPITLGALAVTLAPVVVPKLIELLQAWSLRGEQRKLRLKAQVGDRTVEVEYSPKAATPEELNRLVRMLQQGLTPQTPGAEAASSAATLSAAGIPPAGPTSAPAAPYTSAPAVRTSVPAAPSASASSVAGPPAAARAPGGKKYALVIGNSDYEDSRLAKLAAPDADVRDLAAVLLDPEVGAFDDVKTLVNAPLNMIQREIARFFSLKSPEDMLLLYFTGHGVRDDQGRLSLAVKDTDSELLSGTALPASFITGEMDRSRSRRQVLVLDCCHSGAFAQGSKSETGGSVGTAGAFEGTGFGRVVLTATDATQYAWEGAQITGDAQNSVFTKYLIQGLKTGEADSTGDGRITVDELYDYVYDQVLRVTPKQIPGKWSYRQQGDIILARSRRTLQPVELPDELQAAITSPFAQNREAAVRELARLLRGSNAGMALAARAGLQGLAEDDSRRVANAAAEALAGAPAASTVTPVDAPKLKPSADADPKSWAGTPPMPPLTTAAAGTAPVRPPERQEMASSTPAKPTSAGSRAIPLTSAAATSGSQAASIKTIPTPAPKSGSSNGLLIGGGTVAALLLCCVGALVVGYILNQSAGTTQVTVVPPTRTPLQSPGGNTSATSVATRAPLQIPIGTNFGNLAPDFTLTDAIGVSHQLSSEVSKHRSVVLVFYEGFT